MMQENHASNVLVHWTYTRDEWRSFLRWKNKRKGLLYFVAYRLFPLRKIKAPTVTITQGGISIDSTHTSFGDHERQLRYIQIRDAGRINVMEICYQHSNTANARLTEIRVPVPKGKLKEAIGLEEQLNAARTR